MRGTAKIYKVKRVANLATKTNRTLNPKAKKLWLIVVGRRERELGHRVREGQSQHQEVGNRSWPGSLSICTLNKKCWKIEGIDIWTEQKNEFAICGHQSWTSLGDRGWGGSCRGRRLYMMWQLLSAAPGSDLKDLRPDEKDPDKDLSSRMILQASSSPSLLTRTVLLSVPMFQPPFFITRLLGGLCSWKKMKLGLEWLRLMR